MRKRFRRRVELCADCLKHKLPAYTNSEIAGKIDELIHNEKDRELFRLKLIDGLTLEEASERLDIPYSTARDHYYEQLPVLFPDITGK